MNMVKIFYFVYILNSVLKIITCASLNDGKIISENYLARDLTSQLFLKVNRDNGRPIPNKFHIGKTEYDQIPSSSEILGPSIDVDYADFYKSVGQPIYGTSNNANVYGERGFSNSRGLIGFYGRTEDQAAFGKGLASAYDGVNRRIFHGSSDRGFNNGAVGAHAASSFGKSFNNEQEINQKALAAARGGSKGSHHRGHHSSGFHTSYHKDESGNNTSFYDDAEDTGGHFFLDAKDSLYKDHSDEVNRGKYHRGGFYNHLQGKNGRHGFSRDYAANDGYNQNYGQGLLYTASAGYGQGQNKNNFEGDISGQGRGSALNYKRTPPHLIIYDVNKLPEYSHNYDAPIETNGYLSKQWHHHPINVSPFVLKNEAAGDQKHYSNGNTGDSFTRNYFQPQTSAELGYYGTYRGIAY